jgi:hypothetical protein
LDVAETRLKREQGQRFEQSNPGWIGVTGGFRRGVRPAPYVGVDIARKRADIFNDDVQ